MKKMISMILTAALLLTAFTGCSREAEPQNTQPEPPVEQSTPEVSEEEQPEVQPDEQGESQERNDSLSGEKEGEAEDELSMEKPSEQEEAEETSQSEEQQEEESTEQSAQTQSEVVTEQTSVQGLDTTKLGWGPGGPVDEDNRPSGATSYQEKYGQYGADFIRENEKKIYLTFDEGYENGYTGAILDVLLEKQVPAVFFVTMPYVKSEPELIQRMIDEGHIVGNHSVNHPSFPEISTEECKSEVMELHDYMKENYGYEMSLFRFPMGEFSEADLSVLQQLGYKSVFWSFAYRDWLVDDQPDPQEAIQTIESKCHPGAIYLLHAVSKTNTEILGQVIDDLRAQGYTFCAYE